jgi:hypothetical protein
MEEQVNQLGDRPVQEPAPKTNLGWFRRGGDRRINRQGRPRGTQAACQAGPPVDCAAQADRVMLLWVPTGDLAHRLRRYHAPWIVNLPEDVEIVACRVEAGRDSVAVIIRSGSFPRIATGAPIPEFVPSFEGLRWRRR